MFPRLEVKESIISLWWRSIPIPEPCVRKCCGHNHGSCEFDTATVPPVHRQDLGMEARMVTLQTHAEAQQEQIRMAEVVIQQLRAKPSNPPPPLPAAFQKPVTEGGAFKALTKYTGNHTEHHEWSCSARRVLTGADERCAGLLQWNSGQIDKVKENDVLEYRRTTDLSSTNMDWLNSELYALLAIKTSDHQVTGRTGSQGNYWLATPGT